MPIVPARWLIYLLLLAMARLSQAQEVQVQLNSGRQLSGLVDERSDDAILWLRTERKASYLRRPIAWSQIASVQQNDQPLGKEAVLALTSPALPDQPRRSAPGATVPAVGLREQRLLVEPPRWLSVHAEIGNWDRDAAADGLLLWLFPHGAQGEIIPVAGQVEIECWGLERRHGKPGGELTLVERWSRPIAPVDFLGSGALLKLPYGSVNPIEQLAFNPQGLVRVRLSIPGYDTLEAQLDGIRLRPATPVQDWQRVSELFPR